MTIRVPLTQGKFALIDKNDEKFVTAYRWCYSTRTAGPTGYALSKLAPQTSMHRFIMNAPKGVVVDHIDGDGLNNRKVNLRFATRSQNGQNRAKKDNKRSSKYKGVSWAKPIERWVAVIRANGKLNYLGSFIDEDAAAVAYNHAALEHFGQFALLNEIGVGCIRDIRQQGEEFAVTTQSPTSKAELIREIAKPLFEQGQQISMRSIHAKALILYPSVSRGAVVHVFSNWKQKGLIEKVDNKRHLFAAVQPESPLWQKAA